PVKESLPRRTNCLVPKPLELWPELFVPHLVDLFTRFDERWRESIHNPLPKPLQGAPHPFRDSLYLGPVVLYPRDDGVERGDNDVGCFVLEPGPRHILEPRDDSIHPSAKLVVFLVDNGEPCSESCQNSDHQVDSGEEQRQNSSCADET